MSEIWTRAFWLASVERALKSFAQGVLLVVGVGGITPADIDWKEALLGGGLAAVISVLMSIGSAGVGNAGPSLATEVLSPPAVPVPADEPQP